MSADQLKAFTEAIKADNTLREKLQSVKDTEQCCSIAKEAGFTINTDDIKNAPAILSEEELEGVAGGFASNPLFGGFTC